MGKLSSLKKALDMSHAARMQRAQDISYNQVYEPDVPYNTGDENIQPSTGLQFQGVRVGRETIRELPSGPIFSDKDVAATTRGISRFPQEKSWIVAADELGKPLEILQHSLGMRDSATVDPGIVAGWASGVPGAKKVWFVHNHPSNNSALSTADENMSGQLENLLRGSGVDYEGILAVTPNEYGHYKSLGIGGGGQIGEAGDLYRTPMVERVFDQNSPGMEITNADAAKEVLKTFGDQQGIVLLNNQHAVSGFMPLEISDIKELRHGQLPEVLKALENTNASAAILKVRQYNPNVYNLNRLLNAANIRVLDAFDDRGVSGAAHGYIQDKSFKDFRSIITPTAGTGIAAAMFDTQKADAATEFTNRRAAKKSKWAGLKSMLSAPLEFAAGVNQGVVDSLNFLGPDQVNAILNLSGSEKRIPTFSDIPGINQATQGGFMQEGLPRDIVRTAGEFTSPL